MAAWLESGYDLDDPEVISAIDDVPIWSAPFGLKLLDVVRLRREIRALDVGSGLGFPLVELAQRLGPTSKVYGIDPWEAANRRARAKIRTWKLDNVRVVRGSAERMPFPDGAFQLVVSNNGTNNVEDEEAAFAEIARVAAPGAQILLTLNLPRTMEEFYQVYRQVLRARGHRQALSRLEEHIHRKRKPLDHTVSLARRSGLQVRDLHEDAFRLRYSDGSGMLRSPLVKLAFLHSWTNLLEPGDVANVFREIESELNRRARASGELQLTIPWACIDLVKPDPADASPSAPAM